MTYGEFNDEPSQLFPVVLETRWRIGNSVMVARGACEDDNSMCRSDDIYLKGTCRLQLAVSSRFAERVPIIFFLT